LESFSGQGKITFGVLQTRLIRCVNARIQNGDFTERGLARVLGISQPQIHNVLKGARKLKSELADRLISKLEINLLELLDSTELMEQLLTRSAGVDEMSNASFAAYLKKPPAREQHILRLSRGRAV
jgi:hypothetical protein